MKEVIFKCAKDRRTDNIGCEGEEGAGTMHVLVDHVVWPTARAAPIAPKIFCKCAKDTTCCEEGARTMRVLTEQGVWPTARAAPIAPKIAA